MFYPLISISGQEQFVAFEPKREPMKDPLNISMFTGTSIAQKNTNNQGYWYGLYTDYMLVETPRLWYFGLAALAVNSQFQSNDLRNSYEGDANALGAGIALGKYSYFVLPTYDSYTGANLLIKRELDVGEGISVSGNSIGKYSMTQSDLILSGELNINLLKIPKGEKDTSQYNPKLFPKTQLRLIFQESLRSDKSSFWNNNPIVESLIWNKAAYTGEIRQSLYRIGTYDFSVEPKIITSYSYYKGNQSHWLTGGMEIGLRREWKEDFFSLYFLIKRQIGNFQENLNDTQFLLGINFSPSNLKIKKK